MVIANTQRVDRGANTDDECTSGRTQVASSETSWRAVLAYGLGWTTAARAAGAIGSVAKYLVFARLLRPLDFGIFGAASLSGFLLVRLTDPNFDRALVPQEDEIEPYLDTVWSTTLAQGALVALTLFLMARPLSVFFQIQDSYRVFWATAPVFVLMAAKSPSSTGQIYRSLNFRISFVIGVAEEIAGFVAGLAAILWFHDWRGLVVATYAGHLARAVFTYWYFPYRPRLKFEFARAKKMFAYGRWVTLRGLAQVAAGNLDRVAVGHLLGGVALGEYQMAFRLGEMPATEVANSIGMVSFSMVSRPGYARASKHLFFLSVGATALVGILYGLLMMKWGTAIIVVTVGEKWLGSVPALRWLCFCGLAQGLLSIGTSFLDGLGVPDSSFRLALSSALILAALIYPLTALFGAVGAAAAVLASVSLPVPLMLKLYYDAKRVRE
jgi:O-antigen/teichoic acid export membrane protein